MTTEKEVNAEEAGEVTVKPKSRCDAEESFFMNVYTLASHVVPSMFI